MSPIALEPGKVEAVVMACCSLHNYLRKQASDRALYSPSEMFDRYDEETHQVTQGAWREDEEPQGMIPLEPGRLGNHTRSAKSFCDEFCIYFNSTQGMVPWQHDMI
jgi:hypothetical protein